MSDMIRLLDDGDYLVEIYYKNENRYSYRWYDVNFIFTDDDAFVHRNTSLYVEPIEMIPYEVLK